MSASDHLQRRLFYTAGELAEFFAHDNLTPNVPFKDNSGLFQRKIDESKEAEDTKNRWSGKLYDNIKEHGVKYPVLLHDKHLDDDGMPTIMNGHHRVAAAYDINPDMYIPVEYVK